jgi:hypothetical protein
VETGCKHCETCAETSFNEALRLEFEGRRAECGNSKVDMFALFHGYDEVDNIIS